MKNNIMDISGRAVHGWQGLAEYLGLNAVELTFFKEIVGAYTQNKGRLLAVFAKTLAPKTVRKFQHIMASYGDCIAANIEEVPQIAAAMQDLNYFIAKYVLPLDLRFDNFIEVINTQHHPRNEDVESLHNAINVLHREVSRRIYKQNRRSIVSKAYRQWRVYFMWDRKCAIFDSKKNFVEFTPDIRYKYNVISDFVKIPVKVECSEKEPKVNVNGQPKQQPTFKVNVHDASITFNGNNKAMLNVMWSCSDLSLSGREASMELTGDNQHAAQVAKSQLDRKVEEEQIKKWIADNRDSSSIPPLVFEMLDRQLR